MLGGRPQTEAPGCGVETVEGGAMDAVAAPSKAQLYAITQVMHAAAQQSVPALERMQKGE